MCSVEKAYAPHRGSGLESKAGETEETRLGITARVLHTPHVLLSVPLTGNSSFKVVSGKTKATSRWLTTASMEMLPYLHYQQAPGPDPTGERCPQAQATSRLRLGVCFRRGK